MILEEYFFIINPFAGRKKAVKEWLVLESMLKTKNLLYDFHITTKGGEAQEVVKIKLVEGYRKFIVIGGDGTINEVINGLFSQKLVDTRELVLGSIILGTCNDWARYYKMKKDFPLAIERLISGKTVKQDICKIQYTTENEEKEIFFINVAGLGLDSAIVQSTNKMHEYGRTQIAYFLSLIKCFIVFKPNIMKISIAGEVLEDNFLSMGIGNGKFSGGGMQQTPDALIDDGYLDVSLYPNMPKIKMIANIMKLYKGTIKSLKGIRCFREKTFSVSSDSDILLECDGELVKGNNFEFSVIPLSINVLV